MTHRLADLARGSLALGALTLLLLAAALPARAQLLYEATAPGGGRMLLLGSIHLLRPDSAGLGARVEAAYAEADALVFELDLDAARAGAAAMRETGMLPEGDSLGAHVSPETRALLAPHLRGFLGPMLARTEPWAAALFISQVGLAEAGFSPDAGVDAALFARAKADGKPRVALETVEEQLGFFDTLLPSDQDTFLRLTLLEADSAATALDRIVGLWKAGDAAGLSAEGERGMNAQPALRARLLDDRNAAWVPRLEALVAEGRTPLVVVGALHLVGAGGVAERLRARGFTVVQR